MGVSTVQQLIAKGQAENAYNNSGISTPNQWMDFFNDALRDLVDDLSLIKVGTINFVNETREYDLISDYYALITLNDAQNTRTVKRRHYDQQYPAGYWVFNRGSKHVIDLHRYNSDQTFTYMYQAYPKALATVSDVPEVPNVGERALIYYALSKALRNNNQVGMANEMEEKYERERMKIRTAAARGGG